MSKLMKTTLKYKYLFSENSMCKVYCNHIKTVSFTFCLHIFNIAFNRPYNWPNAIKNVWSFLSFSRIICYFFPVASRVLFFLLLPYFL